MDPQARRTTWELLEELRTDGVTVVLTTHYMDEAERLADHIHIIDQGRLIASGSPAELTREARRRSGWWSPSRSPTAPRRRCRQRSARQVEVTADQRVEPPHRRTRRQHDAGHRRRLVRAARACCRSRCNLGQRNLEDVFLEITGRGLRP